MKRKQAVVLGLVVLAVLARSQAQGQTPAGTPTGRDVFVRGLRVTGTDTVMRKHKTMKMTGMLSMASQGIEAPLQHMKSSANELHVVITVEGMGVFEQGYADSTAYANNPQSGPMILTGLSAQSTKRQSLWVDSPDNYASLTNEGLEKFEGKDAYRVKMVSKDGLTLTRYYDPATGFPMATMSQQESPDGPVPVTTVVSDYSNFGGLMLPTKQLQRIGDTDQLITITKVEFDVVTPAELALPEVIKALKKK